MMTQKHFHELFTRVQFSLTVFGFPSTIRIDNQPIRLHHLILNPTLSDSHYGTVFAWNLLDNELLKMLLYKEWVHSTNEELTSHFQVLTERDKHPFIFYVIGMIGKTCVPVDADIEIVFFKELICITQKENGSF